MITKLRTKQLTHYTNRQQTVDSSTLVWMKQIQSARVCNQPPTSCLQSEEPPPCCEGGKGRDTALMTGSSVRYPSVLTGAKGSASRVYSSEMITMQRAGATLCEMPSANGSSMEIESCNCTSTNGPSSANPTPVVNHQGNPYLPAFDTYYSLKHACMPTQDQNQKHGVVKECL